MPVAVPGGTEGCSEPVWPPCPALLPPWLWGRCQLPKHQRPRHFSEGCSRRCGHCPLLPSPAGPFPCSGGAERAGAGPGLCHSPAWEAPGSHPHG